MSFTHHVKLHLDRLRSPLRLRAGTIPPSLPMQNDLKASQLPPVAICHRLDRCFFFKAESLRHEQEYMKLGKCMLQYDLNKCKSNTNQ